MEQTGQFHFHAGTSLTETVHNTMDTVTKFTKFWAPLDSNQICGSLSLYCCLDNRKQYVYTREKDCTYKSVICGVPQGSVSGPIFSLI